MSNLTRAVLWRRIADALQFFATLLAISSFITALKFFQPQSYASISLGKAIAVTDFRRLFSQDKLIAEKLQPCVFSTFPGKMYGQAYGVVATSGTPTLMNPPLRLEGVNFIFVYYLNESSPTFQAIFSTTTAQFPTETGEEDLNPFSEPEMLLDARYMAGYGAFRPDRHPHVSFDAALSAPHRFQKFVEDRYGIKMFDAILPTRALFLAEDIFPGCVDALGDPPFPRAGYYALASSRDIWTPLELSNDSEHALSDVVLTIDRPWQGPSHLEEKVVRLEGGEVVRASNFYSVVKFPTLLPGAKKLVLLKTTGRPLDRSSVTVTHARTAEPSTVLMMVLGAISIFGASLFFICSTS